MAYIVNYAYQCIKYVYDTGQENAQILSYVNMIQEQIAARDGFKIIQILCKNEIIEFIFYISTIDFIKQYILIIIINLYSAGSITMNAHMC